MFWGISLCFGKRYSQVTEDKLSITMAALEPRDDAVENQMTCVMLEKQGNEYLLCTLEHGRVMQMPLNLVISKGEEYVLYINGNGVVHLTGYSSEAGEILDHETFPLGEETTKQHQSYVSADNENSNDEDDGEEEVGTDRLLVLDDSEEEENEEEEWEPNVSELEDTFGYEYMYGNRPQTRSKKGKHVNFAEDTVVDDSYVLPQLAMDNESDESESSGEENGDENNEEIDDDEIEDLVEDQEIADVQAVLNDGPKKRKKSALVNDKFKRPKTEGIVVEMVGNSSPSKKSKKAKKEKMRENSLEEVNDVEEVDDEMNSSIGRTPMPKKKQGSALKSNSVLMQSPPLSGQGSAKKFGKFSNKLSNGVEYEDTRIGAGPLARQGKVVHVYYTGQFTTGKVFETCGPNEKAYAFRLGRGEVIKGWDVGIEGMRVGGKRKIKIPPPMAYGKKGVGCIPPHSTLIFTIELKAVN